MNRTTVYFATNFAFAGSAVIGCALHQVGVHPVYLVALFAICSSPIFDAKSVNGPYSLLVLWSLDYFTMYGALDYQHALLGAEGAAIQSAEILSAPEMVILVGAGLFHGLYRAGCRTKRAANPARLPKDWSELGLVAASLMLWAISSRLCWEFSVNIMVGKTFAEVNAAFRDIGGVMTGVYMLARMAQPLSIIILAYAQCRYRRAYMLPIVIGVVAFQLLYGFIIDTKSEALIGGTLVIITNVLATGRVPKIWLGATIILIIVAFPIMQANRVVRDERALNSQQASTNFSDVLNRAIQGSARVNSGRERAQTALERTTTKGSVQIIVEGAGSIAPFQNGFTLTPILATFVPRLLWSDKPAIPTGQMMNKEFHLGAGETTYISPSHLGELYWNFGWTGVIFGMSAIGLILGTIGRRFDVSEAATITRVLVLMVTVRQVILSSEGEFATQYVVWFRALVGIGLLHWAFARHTVGVNLRRSFSEPPASDDAENRAIHFPNLLR